MIQQSQQSINFYRQFSQFGEFCNYYISPFVQNGQNYLTNQHYFQSKKFQGNQYQFVIANAKTPDQACQLGQSRQYPLRKDWNQVKDEIMLNGLRLKFQQNEKLAVFLLATGDKKIVEHTDQDSYWGDGGDGSGQNKLGILLMKLRDQLKLNKA